MKIQITVSKLERAEYSGDWHDKPLKWAAVGPGAELQKFSTRREAESYARLRRSRPEAQAIREFINA